MMKVILFIKDYTKNRKKKKSRDYVQVGHKFNKD